MTHVPGSRSTRWLPLAGLALVCLATLPRSAAAQSITAPELKAAFLANFSKFTDWPDDALADGRVFTFCIVDDKAVVDALEKLLGEHPVQGQPPVSVRLVRLDATIRSCQVLYVGKLNAKDSAHLFEMLKGVSIFTVGDDERFAEAGGVAQFILVNGRMRFAINVAAAQRVHLSLSSKLLSLATLVKDAR
jgi:uncharacterized protein DUF4154